MMAMAATARINARVAVRSDENIDILLSFDETDRQGLWSTKR
jgi:hypothetical protein